MSDSIKLSSYAILGLVICLGLASCSPRRDATPPESTLPAPQALSNNPLPDQTSLLPADTSTPLATRSNPSTIVAPANDPTLAPTPDCLRTNGRFEQGGIHSQYLPDPLLFRVYLPPCYAESPERRYPVVYLIHGQSSTDDQWQRLGAGATADRLIAAGQVPPFLIVMPFDQSWKQPGEDPFDEALINELIPYIDRQYRTLPDRQHRAVGGLSRGAGWAVHLGLADWTLFGAIGAHSLAVFWADSDQIPGWIAAIPADQIPHIYIDAPTNDSAEEKAAEVEFEELLTKKGIPHEWHLFPGYHEEKYWATHLEQYLRWYAASW
jgi:enterochelin esterase-like enzyme